MEDLWVKGSPSLEAVDQQVPQRGNAATKTGLAIYDPCGYGCSVTHPGLRPPLLLADIRTHVTAWVVCDSFIVIRGAFLAAATKSGWLESPLKRGADSP